MRSLSTQQRLCFIYSLAVLLSTACDASPNNECDALEAANTSDAGLQAVDQAHQLAVLARQLEDTQQMLHYNQAQFMGSPTKSSGFRYSTFIYGMLLAWALVAIAGLLGWEYLQHHLQRKQQAAAVGGLKDMDDATLKKVLGKVLAYIDCMTWRSGRMWAVHKSC